MEIRLYGEGGLGVYLENLVENSRNASKNWMRADKARVMDNKLFELFWANENGRFWEVFETIDKDSKSRAYALDNFKPIELHDLLERMTNWALYPPELKTPWPGTLNGHRTVYHYFKNPESLLRLHAPKDPRAFEKKLNNGRFWEGLADMDISIATSGAYKEVEDVLLNNFYDLEVSFVPQGIEILGRKDITNGLIENKGIPDLKGLSNNATIKYGEFFERVAELPSKSFIITEKNLIRLIRPYVERVLDRNEDGSLKFPTYRRPDFKDLLRSKFCQAMLYENKELRKKYNSATNNP